MASNTNKKSIARQLFRAGLEQREIAELLGVSENTVSRWAIDGGWREQRIQEETSANGFRQNIFAVLNHSAESLKAASDTARELGDPFFPDKGLIDALQKAHSMIREELGTYETEIHTIRLFLAYLHDHDLPLAQAVLDATQEFLLARRKLHGL